MSRRRSRQAYLIELYQLIADRFDEQKLTDLYDELAVEPHVLPSQGKKSARARELVIYLEQQGRIPALLEKCRQIDPDFDWPDGLAKSKMTEQQEGYTRSAGTGLTLLAELVAAPSIHNAVSNCQKDFEAARNKIEMVSHYKDLHDLFQEMETSTASGLAPVFQPKLNGSMRREGLTVVYILGQTNHPAPIGLSLASCPPELDSFLRSNRSIHYPMAPVLLVHKAWPAASGSGSRTGTIRPTTPPILAPRRMRVIPAQKFSEAAPGKVRLLNYVQRHAMA
ncbi:MAG TPA: hypothetical protein VF177_02190 [Anaerolineae bacterium]